MKDQVAEAWYGPEKADTSTWFWGFCGFLCEEPQLALPYLTDKQREQPDDSQHGGMFKHVLVLVWREV